MKSKKIINSPLKIELENMTYDDMIYIRVQLEKEFKRRGIKFSAGDIGEKLAIEFFNNTPGFSNLQISQTGTRNVARKRFYHNSFQRFARAMRAMLFSTSSVPQL